MEMQNSRRPFDRSRVEPGPKKPRLTEDPSADRISNGGSLIQTRLAAASQAVARFRASERGGDSENSDSGRGSYPQPQQQHNHQELVSQYKTALAELTINSKPIITNLTIIAGESMTAAKAIAATICTNILEVPSDQKLPSLYLLDSIVKNIGRDYIKYFAIRLPEVFCKVYRQVDPSIHSSMRHLFGTWKGVFPPLTLQSIEKELGFTAVNGSASGTTRNDSQTPRPARSIHVNPKYLEARQSLQQPTRAKGTTAGISATFVSSPDDVERLERTASVSSGPGKSWGDPSIKNIQNVQISHLNEPVLEKTLNVERTANMAYSDPAYGSEISRRPALHSERNSEKYKKQGFDKPWYDSESSATGIISGERNGYDLKHGLQNYQTRKSSSAEAYMHTAQDSTNRIGPGLNGSWKNSDEEEYPWDDIHSRLPNHAIAKNSLKDHWATDEFERMELQAQPRRVQSKRDAGGSGFNHDASISSVAIKRQSTLGGEGSPLWPREPHVLDGVTVPVLPARDLLRQSAEGYGTSFNRLSNSQTKFGLSSNALPLEKESRAAASPSAHSPMHQLSPSPSNDQVSFNMAEQDNADTSTSQFSRRSSLDPRQRFYQDTLSSSTDFGSNSQRKMSPGLSYSSPMMISSQGRDHSPFSKHLDPKPKVAEYLDQGRRQPISQISGATELSSLPGGSAPGHSNIPCAEPPLQATTSSLLAAVMSSGILGTNPVTIDNSARSNSEDAGSLSSQSDSHPIPSTMKSKLAAVISRPSEGNASVLSTRSKGGHMERPPLPPSRISSLLASENLAGAGSSPVSSLLSTLVEKGLITSSKEQSPVPIDSRVDPQIPSQSPTVNTSSETASASPVCKENPSLSTECDQFFAKPVVKTSDSLRQPISRDQNGLIGVVFKPDVIRQPHPAVINELLDDLPHRCHTCGHKLKLKEQLDKHLIWHESRISDVEMLSKASRKWYVNSTEWDFGNATSFNEYPDGSPECTEEMVPADESQCLCILCGQLFEDVFSVEIDQWMFKGAVYLSSQYFADKTPRTDMGPALGPIVHINCITETSLHDLGLVKDDIKQED
ncbi:unnamed protein product [Cuscuta campestris]|uniref:CID domain-containing protein n=1 Tax=Cuscuta campestris TaxID=132261 RepID=A0A484MJ57_9ASTE|nr:unnamed protein product [Cuscuta campestris]